MSRVSVLPVIAQVACHQHWQACGNIGLMLSVYVAHKTHQSLLDERTGTAALLSVDQSLACHMHRPSNATLFSISVCSIIQPSVLHLGAHFMPVF